MQSLYLLSHFVPHFYIHWVRDLCNISTSFRNKPVKIILGILTNEMEIGMQLGLKFLNDTKKFFKILYCPILME